MRIALDGRELYRTNRRGIGKTLVSLYRHVLQVRPDWQVDAFHRDRIWQEASLEPRDNAPSRTPNPPINENFDAEPSTELNAEASTELNAESRTESRTESQTPVHTRTAPHAVTDSPPATSRARATGGLRLAGSGRRRLSPQADPGLPSQVRPRCIEMRGHRFDTWLHVRLPLATALRGADVLHCPANMMPRLSPVPVVVTVHDLIPLSISDGASQQQVARFDAAMQRAAHQAAWILCPSNHTASKLVAQYNADPARITVTPWAEDEQTINLSPQQIQQVRRRFADQRQIVLHFGGATARKNTLALLRAWQQLEPSTRQDWQLVIVGVQGQALDRFRTQAKAMGVAHQVHLHGYVCDTDVAALLEESEILAYPSLDEGFGLPVLEAWKSDTAVLVGNRGSLPELAGAAGLKVDPRQDQAIAQGLSRLMNRPSLRHALVTAGRRRQLRYSWDACARGFVGAIEQVTQRGRRVRRAA